MSAPNPTLRELAVHMVETVPQAAALGFKLVSVADGRGSILVPWRAELVGDPATGVIASGVVTSLLDHCCGLAISSAKNERFPTATLDLRIDYMRPAAPHAGVTALAHCYKMTRSIAFVRAHAWDEDPEDPIATAQAAFILNGAPAPGAAR
ncbi:PaaI family thioesterase [Phenylobacterium sp.]|uniref:PaaI family thioesterase n=1 Tax=Phenylobacterium sp. TaxID=1871053 RepID=UPI0027275B57|nr:PaaI family thioesterase [Phenylobacterium sp.]MDO8380094.1 PaaI family thioesterase [Phenylobacterium sp.]